MALIDTTEYVFSLEGSEAPERKCAFQTSTHSDSPLTYSLVCDGKPVSGMAANSLKLLSLLVASPDGIVLFETIKGLIWTDEADDEKWENNLDSLLSATRHQLGYKPIKRGEPGKFVTREDRRIRLLVKVTRSGGVNTVAIWPKWSKTNFASYLQGISKSSDPKEVFDLRLMTTGFNPHPKDIELDVLVQEKRLRIGIIMLDPENEPLVESHFSHRMPTDIPTSYRPRNSFSPPPEIAKQLEYLSTLDQKDWDDDGTGFKTEDIEAATIKPKGSVAIRVTGKIPCGFVALWAERAVFGIFWAQCPYTDGPMLMVPGQSEMWKKLKADWNRRWQKGTDYHSESSSPQQTADSISIPHTRLDGGVGK